MFSEKIEMYEELCELARQESMWPLVDFFAFKATELKNSISDLRDYCYAVFQDVLEEGFYVETYDEWPFDIEPQPFPPLMDNLSQ